MNPDLLWYVCRYVLPKRYRTKKAEEVDALVVHRWAMARADRELNADDEEGIKLLKGVEV